MYESEFRIGVKSNLTNFTGDTKTFSNFCIPKKLRIIIFCFYEAQMYNTGYKNIYWVYLDTLNGQKNNFS